MVWKRTEADQPEQPAPRPAAPPAAGRRETATVGASIRIKGDLSGDEDLLVQGQIEGKISLKTHNITVGPSGRVQADIYGKNIRIEGEVKGNLYGEEEIVIRASGRVLGNLQAPRVTLENGSKFKGSIDMDAGGKRQPAAETGAAAKSAPPATSTSAPVAADSSKG